MTILFAYVCDLLEELERFQHYDIPLTARRKQEEQNEAIKRWFQNHRKFIDEPDTDRAALLSTLLPELRTDRMYGVKESRLGQVLCRCLGLGSTRIERLKSWTPATNMDFGQHIYHIVKETDAGTLPKLKVEELDAALHKLAAMCRWSSPKVRLAKPAADERHMHVVLGPIVRRMLAKEAKWFTRIVLKTLGSISIFEPLVLRCLHPILPEVVKIQRSFEAAVQVLERPELMRLKADGQLSIQDLPSDLLESIFRPVVGVQIRTPGFAKARSTDHCLKLAGATTWSVEEKIDGEFCEIHVDLDKGKDWLQLFSKNGKDSTADRSPVHQAVRESLGVGSKPAFSSKCILQGELIVFKSASNGTWKVQEFHKIRRHVTRSGSKIGTEADSPTDPKERLGLVLFDVLLVDDDAVIFQSYAKRRKRLAEIAAFVPGRIHRGNWGVVDFGAVRSDKLAKELQRAFAKSVASRLEGLVLKPADAPYHTIGRNESGAKSNKFIKFKKDYIPGLGDSADFAVVGATWDVREAQKINLRSMRYTNFSIACLKNKDEVIQSEARPVLKVMGTIGPGFISEVNMQHLSQHGQFGATPNDDENGGNCNFDLESDRFDAAPQYLFKTPFFADVLGSAFNRPSSKAYYMLRHPRITKIHSDRGYEDVVSFTDLQDLAKQAIEVPGDVQQEEKACLKRLCAAEEPKRKRFVSTYSPFSDGATPEAMHAPTETPNAARAAKFVSSPVMPSTPRARPSKAIRSAVNTPMSMAIVQTKMKAARRSIPVQDNSSNEAVQESPGARPPLRDVSNSPRGAAMMSSLKRKSDEAMNANGCLPPRKKPASKQASRPAVPTLSGHRPKAGSPKAAGKSPGGIIERALGVQSTLAKFASKLDPSSFLYCSKSRGFLGSPEKSPGNATGYQKGVSSVSDRSMNIESENPSNVLDACGEAPPSPKASTRTHGQCERLMKRDNAQPSSRGPQVKSSTQVHLSRSPRNVESPPSKITHFQKHQLNPTFPSRQNRPGSSIHGQSSRKHPQIPSQGHQQGFALGPQIPEESQRELDFDPPGDSSHRDTKEDEFARMWREMLPEMSVFSDEEDLDVVDSF